MAVHPKRLIGAKVYFEALPGGGIASEDGFWESRIEFQEWLKRGDLKEKLGIEEWLADL